ncbi:Two-component system sensor histidine kinase/response regulator hybrid [Cupriavidus sp. U2]|uniref:sensor histidine kinase n=1 Tax=Cupriavidus sp. U2 TaxID=2920269 RepID=UPI00129E55CD|nr:ATP-binding protein [Cupriavidus sp. U2]KAI3590906.1 Two-component system sensor histidine kinase/response regulator hybrid [Cupriavidus sp. U2]
MRWVTILLLGASVALATGVLPRPRAAPRRRGDTLRVIDTSPFSDIASRPGMVELAGSLAHELNQPLTAITSNAQAAREYLMSGTPDQGEIRDILDDIVSDASRASDIVKGVRALIRGEAPHLVPFQIGDVIARALDLVRDEARTREVTVDGTADRALPRAVGDPMEIQLVLLNLLVNALDAVEAAHARGARKVSVGACAQDGVLKLTVRDNGCGVAEGDLDKIFRPFFSSKPKGMGLGLSFSRALMERNGGRLRAIRNSDRGMTFECLLRTELPASATAHRRGHAVVAARFRTAFSRR